MMTDTERQELHRLLLIGARGAGERGRGAKQFAQDVKIELGREMSEDQVTSELRQLGDRKLVAPLTIPLVGVRWIITSRGEDTLAEAGL